MTNRDSWTLSTLFVLIAAFCFFVAIMAVVFEIDEPKLYPGTIAAGLFSYMVSHLLP